jgi:hypothetical protein
MGEAWESREGELHMEEGRGSRRGTMEEEREGGIRRRGPVGEKEERRVGREGEAAGRRQMVN